MKKIFIFFFISILIAGICRDLYYAYNLSGYLDADCATIGLMASDVLNGKFNTFYYGQDYNGALDSFFIAPFIYLLGLKAFPVFLGMIIQHVIFLFTIYILGRIVKNRTVGILASIYLAVATYPLLHSSVFPYGYHINIMILGNLILIFTLLIDTKGNNIRIWILLGLCAGLGFWDHYIILYYLVPSTVFLLIPSSHAGAGLIKGIFKRFKYCCVAIIAFFIGGLPFWKYNIQSGFPSLINRYSKVYIYEESFHVSFWQTLKKLFGYHISGLLGAGRINISVFIIWGIFAFASIVFCVKLNRRRFLLVLFLCSFFSFSLLHGYFVMADKYYFFLPLYTFISICFGYFIDWVYEGKRYLGIGLFLFVILFNFSDFTLSTYEWRPDKKDIEVYNYRNTAYKGLIEFLYANKIDAIVSDFYTTQGINFMTNKKVSGSEFRDGRAPTDELMQAGDRLALVDRAGERNFINFLISSMDVICEDYKQTQFFDYKIIYDFNKYAYCGRSIDNKNWRAYSNYNREFASYGFDRNLDKYWSSKEDKKPDMYYELDLSKKYNIYKLIVVNKMPVLDNLPSSYKIEISCDKEKWDLVRKGYSPEPLFWSGPRIYWDYRNGRWEVIFKPAKARYIRIKNTDFGRCEWVINELFVYEYLEERELMIRDYIKDAKRIYNYLVSNNIKFVYADYWLSAKIRKWSKDRIGALRIANECYPRRDHTSRILEINNDTVFFIDKENDEEVEKMFSEFGLSISKMDFGKFVYYRFKILNEWQKYFLRNQKCLYWTGISIGKINLYAYNYILTNYGMQLEKKGDLTGAVCNYKKAIDIFPRNNIARERLARFYEFQKKNKEAEKQLHRLRHLCYPKIAKKVVFKNGIIFRGYSLFQHMGKIYVNYYWCLPKKVPKNISVFVHFVKDGKIIFQNDHDFLSHFIQPVLPLDGMIYVEREYIKIPDEVESGIYEIQLGLYRVDIGIREGIKGTKKTKSSIGTVKIGGESKH